MNKEVLIIEKRIKTYRRKIVWNTKRLALCLDALDDDRLHDIDKIAKYELRIMIYNRQLAWNIKRLAKCENVKLS